MVIVDFSNVMMASLYAGLKGYTNVQLDESMLRHMVLNSLRSIRQKFHTQYGEIVIACDDINSWRRKVYPYYKIRRKKNKEVSELDWPFIHEMFAKFISEINSNFPYRVIQVDGAEADDIIGVLCHEFGNTEEKLLIVSNDADFIQLMKFDNVEIYRSIKNSLVKHI